MSDENKEPQDNNVPINNNPQETQTAADWNGDVEPATSGTGDPLPTTIAQGIENQPEQVVLPPEPVPAPTEAPVGFPPVVPPVKKRKKGLIAAIIVAIFLVVFGGGSAAAYFLWYQNPDKVVTDALINAALANTVELSGEVDLAVGNDYKLSLTVDGKQNNSDAAVNGSATLTLNGQEISLKISTVFVKDGIYYVKVEGVREALQATLGDMATFYLEYEPVSRIINKIEGQWIKIAPGDIDELSQDASKSSACVNGLAEKFDSDPSYVNELANVYRNNAFVKVGESVGSEAIDGVDSYKYELKLDDQAAKQFGESIKETKAYKELKDCESLVTDLLDDSQKIDYKTTEEGYESTATIWVTKLTHKITKFEFNGKGNDSSLSTTVLPKFDVPVEVVAPENAVSLEEFANDLQKIYTDYLVES